jgi:hypothetical protein
MSIIKQILKIIGIIVATLILLFILLTIWVYFHDQKTGVQPFSPLASSTFELMLADPHVLYASSFWSGMCFSSVTKEEGGCSSETYLYDTGKYVFTSHWEGLGNKRVDQPRTEKELGKEVVDRIIENIRDSKIMSKECPNNMTMDAGWDYQLQFDGQKKRFINRPAECQPTLDAIDKIIIEAAKTVAQTN